MSSVMVSVKNHSLKSPRTSGSIEVQGHWECGLMPNGRAERFETFVTWYLRFNGYFTVPSFYVHAGDDPKRISGDTVGNLTEVDTLAIRLPYSREESGAQFPIAKNLLEGAEGRF